LIVYSTNTSFISISNTYPFLSAMKNVGDHTTATPMAKSLAAEYKRQLLVVTKHGPKDRDKWSDGCSANDESVMVQLQNSVERDHLVCNVFPSPVIGFRMPVYYSLLRHVLSLVGVLSVTDLCFRYKSLGTKWLLWLL
jgi:hypothetical protein